MLIALIKAIAMFGIINAPVPFIESAVAPTCNAGHLGSEYTDSGGTDWACDGLMWRTK